MAEIARASRALKDATGCDKLNVAAIGNVVPQLHVHMVARRKDDPLWPKPVWGASPGGLATRPRWNASSPRSGASCCRLDLFPLPIQRRRTSIRRSRAMTFRIAVVQPISHRPGEDERNVADAVHTIERAAARRRAFCLLPGDLSGAVAHAGDLRSDRGDGRGRRQPWRACRVRHDRADRRQSRDRLQPHLHGLSGRPRAGALPAHASERPVDLYRRHGLGVPIRAGRRVPGVRHGARQGRARHVQRGLHAGSLARARVARRRTDFHAGRQGQAQSLGDLADADLGARDRESRGRGHDAEPVPSRRARPRHGRGARGDPVREHRRRHERGRRQPRPRAVPARTRDEVGSSERCAAKQGVLGPQWQRPELYDTFYPRPLREAAE